MKNQQTKQNAEDINLLQKQVKSLTSQVKELTQMVKNVTPELLDKFIETKSKKINKIDATLTAMNNRMVIISEVQYFIRSCGSYSNERQLAIANRMLYATDLPNSFWSKQISIQHWVDLFEGIELPKTTIKNRGVGGLIDALNAAERARGVAA